MPLFYFIWDGERHLAEHGVSSDEFEEIVSDPDQTDRSDSTGRPIAFGYTSDGRYLACIYELVDEVTVYAITAYEI